MVCHPSMAVDDCIDGCHSVAFKERSLKRFYGTIATLVVLVLITGLYVVNQGARDDGEELQPEIFRFEAEQLVGIRVVRPDQTIEVKKNGLDWEMVDTRGGLAPLWCAVCPINYTTSQHVPLSPRFRVTLTNMVLVMGVLPSP